MAGFFNLPWLNSQVPTAGHLDPGFINLTDCLGGLFLKKGDGFRPHISPPRLSYSGVLVLSHAYDLSLDVYTHPMSLAPHPLITQSNPLPPWSCLLEAEQGLAKAGGDVLRVALLQCVCVAVSLSPCVFAKAFRARSERSRLAQDAPCALI